MTERELTPEQKRHLGANVLRALREDDEYPTCRECGSGVPVYAPETCGHSAALRGGQGHSAADVERDGSAVGLVLICAFFVAVGVFIGRVL